MAVVAAVAAVRVYVAAAVAVAGKMPAVAVDHQKEQKPLDLFVHYFYFSKCLQ